MPGRDSPNQGTPWVEDGELHLVGEDDSETALPVGSVEWFVWLESAQKFYVKHPQGNFSCRKEPRERGGLFWNAYRRLKGYTARAHIGHDPELTWNRLNEIAERLAQQLAERIEPSDETKIPATRLRVGLAEVLDAISSLVQVAEGVSRSADAGVGEELAREARQSAKEGRRILRKHGRGS